MRVLSVASGMLASFALTAGALIASPASAGCYGQECDHGRPSYNYNSGPSYGGGYQSGPSYGSGPSYSDRSYRTYDGSYDQDRSYRSYDYRSSYEPQRTTYYRGEGRSYDVPVYRYPPVYERPTYSYSGSSYRNDGYNHYGNSNYSNDGYSNYGYRRPYYSYYDRPYYRPYYRPYTRYYGGGWDQTGYGYGKGYGYGWRQYAGYGYGCTKRTSYIPYGWNWYRANDRVC